MRHCAPRVLVHREFSPKFIIWLLGAVAASGGDRYDWNVIQTHESSPKYGRNYNKTIVLTQQAQVAGALPRHPGRVDRRGFDLEPLSQEHHEGLVDAA